MVGAVSDRDARGCASRLIVGFLYDARTRFIPKRWVLFEARTRCIPKRWVLFDALGSITSHNFVSNSDARVAMLLNLFPRLRRRWTRTHFCYWRAG